jgi:hypothetical protein
MRRSFVALFALLTAATAVVAQDVAPADAVVACRQTENSVALKVRLSMSPCWFYGGAEAEYPAEGVVRGIIATTTDAEVCNQSLSLTEIRVGVLADPSATTAEVTVLSPDGTPFATGRTEIVPLGTECPDIPR